MTTVLYNVDNHIATVTLNRPEALNSFNYEMLETLDEVVEDILTNADVRVVLITATGEKAFSVGAKNIKRGTG